MLAAKSCRVSQEFRGHPDVYGWQNAGVSSSASATVRLAEGQKYFVVVRATNGLGQQFYANSNGFIVDSTFVEEREEIQPRESHTKSSEGSAARSVIFAQAECSINQAWKCNAGQVSVREKLEEFYGPPRFGVIAGFAAAPVVVGDDDDDSDDDDDAIGGGGAFGIAVAITAFFCILVLGVMFIAAFGKEGGEFQTNVRRHDNVDEF